MSGGSGRSREWDAATYDRVSTPQLEWSRAVIARLRLAGDESVLDAGCGSGRVSELLLVELPRGRLVGVDGSAAMLERARGRLGTDAELVHSDLLDLDLGERFDAIFSNAVFHWIHDHERLFAALARHLRPGGRLEAQCGGAGNVAAFYEATRRVAAAAPFREHLDGFDPTSFAAPGETAERLAAAGFERIECGLEERLVRPPEPRCFVESVCLGAHLGRLPGELRGRFRDAVLEQLGSEVELRYVRLNISARRPTHA